MYIYKVYNTLPELYEDLPKLPPSCIFAFGGSLYKRENRVTHIMKNPIFVENEFEKNRIISLCKLKNYEFVIGDGFRHVQKEKF